MTHSEDLNAWQWHRAGTGYIGQAHPQSVQFVGACATGLLEQADNLLADPRPALLTEAQHGPIADVIFERAVTQYDLERDPQAVLNEELTGEILRHIADVAAQSLRHIPSDGGMVALPDEQAREAFLWLLGDLWIAFHSRARLVGENVDEHGRGAHELRTHGDWFRTIGQALEELAPSASAVK